MLWNKENYTYSKKDNLLDTDFFVNILDKLKTYSKCINASGYSVTNTLNDVYNILKFQHAFWITLTDIAPDSIILEGLTLYKGIYYNLSKELSDDVIIASESLRNFMDIGYIKSANSLLFEEAGADDFFTYYQPIVTTYYGTNGTNAPIINTSSSGAVIQGTNFIDNTITTVITWDYGTYGTSFNHILIDSSYTLSSWKTHYQNSWVEGEYGYTQRNLFTSEKVLSKLLKNFVLVDLASTENIDITKSYPLLNIDGEPAVAGQKILLKNQTVLSENGVYLYFNKKLTLDTSFDSEEDFYLFSVYVKEGTDNKEKQFFLDREPNGEYPLLTDDKTFIEATNYIVRNRLSYILLQNHSFSDVSYFTQNEPLTTFDFTERLFITSDYYLVNDNFKSLDYYNGTNAVIKYKNFSEDIQFSNKINEYNNSIYLTGKSGDIFYLYQDSISSPIVAGTQGTNLVYDYFSTICELPLNVVDFKILDTSHGLFLSNVINNSIMESTIQGIIFNSSSFMNPITLNGATEFEYLNNGNEYFFYVNYNMVGLYFNGNIYQIKMVNNANKLRIKQDGSIIHVSYLVNNKPQELCIDEAQLNSMLSWEKDIDYELNFFSKEKIGNWEIKNNNLYLKDVQITNLSTDGSNSTSFNYLVPKISNGNYRTYDGINDYSDVSTIPMNTIENGSGSFTIEFKINPNELRTQMPVFYFGEKSKTFNNPSFGYNFSYQLPVFNYITFILKDDDGFPYFMISENSTNFIKLKSNRIIKDNTPLSVAFTWQYTANKATGRLYFKEDTESSPVLVGTIVDQKSTGAVVHLPISIKNLNFETCLLGKSEFSYPNFKGDISQFRVWDRELNPSQLNSRIGKTVNPTDVLYSNLKGYWKLDDSNSYHLETIANSIVGNVFIGGLNKDPLLPTINSASQIQLSSTNLFILENSNVSGTSSVDIIYRIDLADEKIYKLYSTLNTIKSIYLENNDLYFIENNVIQKFNSSYTDNTINYVGSGIIDDFAIVDGLPYTYNSDNNIYNSGTNSIFISTISSLKYIYGSKQGNYGDIDNQLNIYLMDNNGYVHLLSDDYSNTTSGTQLLEFIGMYPLTNDSYLTNGSNSYVVNGLIITKDGINLDSEGLYWSKNLKTIHGIYNRQDGKILVLLSTIYNELQLWQYNNYENSYSRFIDKDNNSTLILSDSIFDLTYHYVNNEEYIAVLNSDGKSITWYKLQKDNKISWTCEPWVKNWSSVNTPISIDTFSGTNSNIKISIVSKNVNQLYLSNLNNTFDNYNLWEDCLTYTNHTDGIIIGDSGITFYDNSSTSWSIELKSLLYKNNFNDVEVYISDDYRDNGYVVSSWSGTIWMVGKSGVVIKSIDNGVTWNVCITNVNFDLNSISFFGDKNGLIAGDSGTLLATFSGGDKFEPIILPSEIANRDWKKVLMYSSTNAILLGNSGTLIHLNRVDFVWSVDRILNNLELTTLDKQILDSDLDYFIKLNIVTSLDSDQYQQTLNDVIYLGDNKFLICGNSNMLLHMELVKDLNFKMPILNFFSTNTTYDWKGLKSYVDLETNEKRTFILSDKNIYSFEYDRIVTQSDTNVHSVNIDLFYTSDESLNKVEIDNNQLYTAGDRVSIIKKSLFAIDSTSGIGDTTFYKSDVSLFEEQDLRKVFQPKMLFLDYYLGRKINLHMEDGTYEVPKASFPKSLLSCYYFLPGEYIEFTDYGTVNNQNNFLSFQDYYYLNRRVLDGGLDKFGKMESWIKYNKRITAASTSGYINDYIWDGEYSNDIFDGTSFNTSGTNFFRLVNDLVNSTSGETYITGSYNLSALPENSYATKIQVNSLDFVSAVGDVINMQLTKTDKSIIFNDGFNMYLKVITTNTLFDIDSIVTIENGFLKYGYLNISTNSLLTKNVLTLETAIKNEVLNSINIYESENLLPISTLNDISVDLSILILNDNFIVRDYNTVNKTITLWTILDQDIIEDTKYGSKILLNNLNYFNGNLIHLGNVFNKHLLSQSYSLNVNTPTNIYVEGVVNDFTKYYNLESYLNVKVNNILNVYPIAYSDDVVYGPKYDLLSFLNDIDPIFDENYSFDLPSHTFIYNPLTRTSSNEFKEFTIAGNKIYVGEDLSQALDFVHGTFIDINRGAKNVKRVYLSKVETTFYVNYPDKKRYVLHFNSELEYKLQDSSTSVLIRSRNTLSEISQDLEFTDDLMIPLPNGSNGVEIFNSAYFNQTKTATAYVPYILNDVNIRNNISAVVYLDSDNDWNINIIDWKNDPNLYYRPVDLHELGIDNVFKKAISVETYNLGIDGNRLVLKDIDVEKYNYRLVDGLTVQQLELKYYWILNADMRNAIIGENDNGLVWYQGDWLCGTWLDGTWYSGRALNIEWVSGNFYSYVIHNNFNLIDVIVSADPSNSIWYKGTFNSGNFYNGTWYSGTFYKGNKYDGLWYGGQFISGTWYAGNFMGGDFFDGTWLSGTFSETSSPSVWHYGTWLGGDFENGKWLNGIWDQTVRVKSRFGTKSSLLHQAIWEYGWWKGGEFHSGLTLDSSGNTIPSVSYSNSIWYNGVWEKGNFYGGTWKMGRFNNGVWYNGLWLSNLDIDSIDIVYDEHIEIKFKTPHYFKSVPGLTNTITIIGVPIVTDSISDNAIDLGHNTKPVNHEVVEIVDEYSIIIQSNISLHLKPFDYAVVRYKNSVSGGLDIDTRTSLFDLDVTYDNVPVGFGKGNLGVDGIRTVGPFGTPFLTWGGDNISGDGSESVLIDFKKMSEIYSTQYIYVNMRAYWYTLLLNGKLKIEFQTYVGGVMEHDTLMNDFINVPDTYGSSGQVVQTLTVDRTTLIQFNGDNVGSDMGNIIYNVANKTASIVAVNNTDNTPKVCYDYTLEDEIETSTELIPLDDLGYINGPFVVSHWLDGTWKGGIFNMGLFSNGFWTGGIFIDGVVDNGTYGE